MKTFIQYLILDITLIAILVRISNAQNYPVEQIPNPFSNITKAELHVGNENSLHIIGLSDTLISSDFYHHFMNLFLTTRNADGFSNEFVVIDTGHTESWGFSGMDNEFNCSMAENSYGQLAVAWTKQYTSWTDVVNHPRYFDAPTVKFGIKENNTFKLKHEFSNADNPQIVTDQNDNFHFVRQSVSPLYPISPDHDIYGPDSNYYFITSKILYNQIKADGTIDTTINLGNGFFPHIHLDKNGIIHLLWLEADSSNSKYFKFVYTKKSEKEFDPVITIKDSIHGQWDEYNIHDYPSKYSSFVDDSGRVYVGWTDNNDYYDGKIFFARLSEHGIVDIDSISDLILSDDQAVFSVDHSGIIHIIWRTLKYPDWSVHYTRGSSSTKLFSSIRTFQSIYYGSNPLIILSSEGVADGMFNVHNGIGYLRDLNEGADTTETILTGASIGFGFNAPRLPPSNEYSVTLDESGQMWVLYSRDGLALMKMDTMVTNITNGGFNPQIFTLSQNYPNPFNIQTTIRFEIGKRARVRLTVADILGREIIQLIDEKINAGKYNVSFDASKLSSGVYFYTLHVGEFKQTRKMLLLK